MNNSSYIIPYALLLRQLGIRGHLGEDERVELTREQLLSLIRVLLASVHVDEAWYKTTYKDIDEAIQAGLVASAKFAVNSRSQPTFLDLDKPYPNAPFTAVIFGDDRPKFGTPETSLRGKRVCVTGQIRDYRGKPEIRILSKSQITEE